MTDDVTYETNLTTIAALRARVATLEDTLAMYREAVSVDVKMEGPSFMGMNRAALKRAWEHDDLTRRLAEAVSVKPYTPCIAHYQDGDRYELLLEDAPCKSRNTFVTAEALYSFDNRLIGLSWHGEPAPPPPAQDERA